MTMSSSDFTLTRDEANSFLRDVLCLSTPAVQTTENRVDFVADIVKGILHHLPFQTVTGISTPSKERHPPTPADIKRDAFARLGGLCFMLNTFIWMLLRALDFEVMLVPCDLRQHMNVHLAVIVQNLTTDSSKHLVEVGNAYPTFRPIPLDFQEQSPVYRDSYLRYKFIREANVIIRLHDVETDPGRRKEFEKWTKDGWYYYFHMHLDKVVDMKYFKDVKLKMYTDHENGMVPFLTSVRCVAYPNGRFRSIKDTTLLVEEENGIVKKTYLKSIDEILAAFAQFFPQIPKDMVNAALADTHVKLDFNKQL